MICPSITNRFKTAILFVTVLVLTSDAAFAQCGAVPAHAALTAALDGVVAQGNPAVNGGLAFEMWATVVNRDGLVCAVTFSGGDRDDQWPGSRVISAQQANTANAFSLAGFPLSTANLYAAVQPGGTLFGLSCTDHIVAWKLRHALNLDNVPGGVAGGTDNILFDIRGAQGNFSSKSGFGHPECGSGTAIAEALPETHPIGAAPSIRIRLKPDTTYGPAEAGHYVRSH